MFETAITAKGNEMIRIVFVMAILAVFARMAQADNWGHWRGPTGNGVAVNANPPVEFSDKKNVKWKTKIPGRGSGSPVVWEQRVFVVTAVPTKQNQFGFHLMCFDRQTGKPLWDQTAVEAAPHQKTHQTNNFSSASPCTDGEHVYAHFGSRGLFCYTMDGKLVWERNFGQMKTRNDFGEGSSPTLVGNTILVPWDHDGPSFLYALDKKTGKTIWETKRDEPTCWATPLVVDNAGKKQVVMNGQNCARSYDLETGKELWRCGMKSERPCSSAAGGDGLVFVGGGHKGDFLGAFRLDGSGDIAGTKSVAWSLDRDVSDVASPILSNGRLYFYKGKTGQLSCLDAATGKPFYMASRVPGMKSTYASPFVAGGHIYLTDRDGTIVVISDSKELKIVATNKMGETVDATPAPVDNELFIRGEEHLFCLSSKR